jgi:ATP-dependent DNA ligase
MSTQFFLYAFDLLQLNGEDYRQHPIETNFYFVQL